MMLYLAAALSIDSVFELSYSRQFLMRLFHSHVQRSVHGRPSDYWGRKRLMVIFFIDLDSHEIHRDPPNLLVPGKPA